MITILTRKVSAQKIQKGNVLVSRSGDDYMSLHKVLYSVLDGDKTRVGLGSANGTHEMVYPLSLPLEVLAEQADER